MKTKEDIYQSEYKKLKSFSEVLNPRIAGSSTRFWDTPAIKSRLYELEGDSEGYIKGSDGFKSLALIPSVEEAIAKISGDFEKYKIKRLKQGFAEPEKMTPEMKKELEKLKAQLDVYKEEEQVLKKWLKERKEKTERLRQPLRGGLVQSGRLSGGELVELDGQIIETCPACGLKIISDPDSIYCGMDVITYRRLAKTWYAEYCKTMGIGKKPKKPPLPEWPQDAVNHLSQKHLQSKK